MLRRRSVLLLAVAGALAALLLAPRPALCTGDPEGDGGRGLAAAAAAEEPVAIEIAPVDTLASSFTATGAPQLRSRAAAAATAMDTDDDNNNEAAADKSQHAHAAHATHHAHAHHHHMDPTATLIRPPPGPLPLSRPPTPQALFRADRLFSCAWAPVLSPEKDKPFMPDMNIQYNIQGFVFASNAAGARRQGHSHGHKHTHTHTHMHHTPKPTPAPTPVPYDQEEVYRIRGRYPYVRYFSFTTYDRRLQTVATLHDTQIKPASGKNPFLDPSTQESEAGTYEIYITKDGQRGYPNELAALRPNATSVYSIMAMRLQLLDPRKGLYRNGKNRDWGYVDMPVVEIRNPTSGAWEAVRRCPEHFRLREEDFIEHLDLSFNKWWPRHLHLGADCNATEFSLFDPERNPVIRRAVAARNDNENYVFWCMPREVLAHKEYVVRIAGLLPQTPYGLYDDIRVADVGRYDARYVSFTSGDAAPLYPSYHTLHDTAIRAHYTGSPTGEGWDRRYTIVAAADPDVAARCGLYREKDDLLLLFRRPPLPHPPHNPAIVMRELLPRGGTARSGTEGVASVSLRDEGCMDPSGKLLCDPTTAARSLLKEFYPRVEVFVCKEEGHGHENKHGHGHKGGPMKPMRVY